MILQRRTEKRIFDLFLFERVLSMLRPDSSELGFLDKCAALGLQEPTTALEH